VYRRETDDNHTGSLARIIMSFVYTRLVGETNCTAAMGVTSNGAYGYGKPCV